jgi:hypothetical protein
MALIGSILKRLIEWRAQFNPIDEDLRAAQRKELKEILGRAKNTAIGKYYNFNRIAGSDDIVDSFQKAVPIHDYEQMAKRWWQQSLLEPDLVWPGKPKYFARSSGTTGTEPKRIPVTDDFLESIQQVSVAQLLSIADFDFPDDFFEREMLAFSSITNLIELEDHWEGEISAITAKNRPGWFEGFFQPSEAISNIEDWDERIMAMAKEAPQWDVGVISGIPSWVLLALQKIMAYHKLDNIHQLWPGLKLYTSGGVAFEPYREKFEAIFGKDVAILDTYLASEGFFAYTASPESMSMRLAYQHGYFFEFIPFDERGFSHSGDLIEKPLVLSLDEVSTDQDYALLITTKAGAFRYMIGDLVRFTRLNPLEIIISGRTKHFLNVVGSQLSEPKMDDAIKALESKYSLNISEYSLAAVEEDDGYYHHWLLGMGEKKMSAKDLAETIDGFLKDRNKNYAVARKKALQGVRVFTVPVETFYRYQEEKRGKGGQLKVRKLLTAEDFRDLKEYCLQETT